MKFTQGSGDKFENAEPGTYPAVCTRVIDLGTQESNYQGEKKFARKLMLVFELAELMKDGRPFLAMRSFTASLHDKSAFKKFIVGWRGVDFTIEQIINFDPQTLIGKGCLLSLIQNGDFVNLDHASKLPKGMAAPTPVNHTVYLDLDNFKQEEFDKLSDKMKQKVMNSPEYQALGKKGGFAGVGDMPDDLPWKDEKDDEDIQF